MKGRYCMLELIKNKYGNEIKNFEFDYLGEHPDLDVILFNANIGLYEKGLLILSELMSNKVFINWEQIKSVKVINSIEPIVKIFLNNNLVIKLQKVKKETKLKSFLDIIEKNLPNLEIKNIKIHENNIKSFQTKFYEKNLIEQENRIKKIILEGWMIKLQNGCNYPFKAEIIDEQTSLNIGSVVEVEGINYIHNELGIMVSTIYKGQKKVIPLFNLEVISKKL
jgi:hypothetical protein